MIDFQYIVDQLRHGRLTSPDLAELDQIPAHEVIAQAKSFCPIVFLERTVGHKYEIGLAHKIVYYFEAKAPDPALQWTKTVLRPCILLSAYDDVLSEISPLRSISFAGVENRRDTFAFRISRGH